MSEEQSNGGIPVTAAWNPYGNERISSAERVQVTQTNLKTSDDIKLDEGTLTQKDLDMFNKSNSHNTPSQSQSISEMECATSYPPPPALPQKEEDLNIGESKISKTLSEKTTKTVNGLIK